MVVVLLSLEVVVAVLVLFVDSGGGPEFVERPPLSLPE
jgi:hypothetical protein